MPYTLFGRRNTNAFRITLSIPDIPILSFEERQNIFTSQLSTSIVHETLVSDFLPVAFVGRAIV